MSTSSVGIIGQQGQQATNAQDAWGKVEMSDFVKLLVTELSSQDPLEPMDNSQILQQISQMRDIVSSDRLTETLESVKLGQNMSTAAGLIGQTIVALNGRGERVIGEVDRVSIEFGVPKLHVGQQAIDMRNVAGILSSADQAEEEETMPADDPEPEANT